MAPKYSVPASPATRFLLTRETRPVRRCTAFSAAVLQRCQATIFRPHLKNWTSCGRQRRCQNCSRSDPNTIRLAPRCRSKRSDRPRIARPWWSFSPRRQRGNDHAIRGSLFAVGQLMRATPIIAAAIPAATGRASVSPRNAMPRITPTAARK